MRAVQRSVIKSACLPVSSDPISFRDRRRARLRWLPWRRLVRREIRWGSPVLTFCRSAARFISSIRSKSLLLPAGPSVPRPTGIPSAKKPNHGRHAACEFHIARRAMCDSRTVRLQDLCVDGIQPDAVRDNGPAIQYAERFHQPRRASCGACAARRRFRFWSPRHEWSAARGICWRAGARLSDRRRHWCKWRAAPRRE